MILALQTYWAEQGCLLVQPYDLETGAGTFHWATALRALGPTPWRVAYVQPCRRPADGRYGQNPNRLQHYFQFQVLLKPSPRESQELYLGSLERIGLDATRHDIRFVEDDWESPTLGATGLGWEIWCDGMEISQFTYFQQMASLPCHPVSTEITYGLERLAMLTQQCDDVFQLRYNDQWDYGALFQRAERDYSKFNFECSDPDVLTRQFDEAEKQAQKLGQMGLAQPSFDYCLKASHCFNLLEARGVLGPGMRQSYVERVRNLVRKAAQTWLEQSA